MQYQNKIKELLFYQTRRCSACTKKGHRCKLTQCNASKVISLLPNNLRKAIETKLYELGSMNRCNYDPMCCALCYQHMILILNNILFEMSAQNAFQQMNTIHPNDWRDNNISWKVLLETLNKEFVM